MDKLKGKSPTTEMKTKSSTTIRKSRNGSTPNLKGIEIRGVSIQHIQ